MVQKHPLRLTSPNYPSIQFGDKQCLFQHDGALVTCQNKASQTLKQILLCQFYSYWDHTLHNEHSALLTA